MVFNIQLPFFTADVERTTALPIQHSIHSSSTSPWKTKSPHPGKGLQSFHIFPTPYYGYYNKFNKENRFLHRIP